MGDSKNIFYVTTSYFINAINKEVPMIPNGVSIRRLGGNCHVNQIIYSHGGHPMTSLSYIYIVSRRGSERGRITTGCEGE